MKRRTLRWACVVGAFFFVAAGPCAAETTERPRGLWFWSKPSSPHGAANVVGDAARETEALAAFRRWNIRRIYGSYATLPDTAPAALAAWNRRLHENGVRSESLFSDAAALTPPGRAALLKQIDERVLRFNAGCSTADERFDGIALDIEPHALPRWKDGTAADRRALLEEFIGTCLALRVHLDEHGGGALPISAALACWLDRLPPEGRVGWASAADRDDWFARLARGVASISLMAYERSRADAVLEATAWERANFPGQIVTALRARLGVEWKSPADLRAVLPRIEVASPLGVDLENYELLRLAEVASVSP